MAVTSVTFGIIFSVLLSQANTATTRLPVLCDSLKAPINGLAQCSRSGLILECTVACNTGFVFDNGLKSITRTCFDVTGVWSDVSPLPTCVKAPCSTALLPSVNDSQITASSTWSGVRGYFFGADRARLDSHVIMVNNIVQSGGWRPNINSLDQYIQVELNSVMRITSIVTKGRAVLNLDTANEYVTRFRVLYSMDGINWAPYNSLLVSDQFLAGNTDNTSPVENVFTCPFDARYVRINPLAWHENIAMRFELYGCQPEGKLPLCTSSGVTSVPTPTTPIRVPSTPQVPHITKPADLCTAPAPPRNGLLNCEVTGSQFVCVARCSDGYVFETRELLIKRTCDRNTGAWRPQQSLPTCIYSLSTPLPPAHNFTNGCLTIQKECDSIGNGDFQACGGCHFFATCSEGYLYVRACPEALLFDSEAQLCDYHSSTCPGFVNVVG